MRPHLIACIASASALAAIVACMPDYTFQADSKDGGAPADAAPIPSKDASGDASDAATAPSDGGGDAIATDATAPLPGAATIVMGYGETCAIDGGAWSCWGAHTHNGNLGFAVDGGGPLNVPTQVSFAWGAELPDQLALAQYDFGGDWTFGCARHGGAAYCYGNNDWWQLAHDRPTGPEMSIAIESWNATADDITALAVGGTHACGITSRPAAGAPTNVFCWGFPDAGRTGRIDDPHDRARAYPIQTYGGATFTAIAIAAGSEHTCAIASDQRSVHCWGVSTYGQAGAPQAQCPGLSLSRVDPCNYGAFSIPLSLDAGETVKELALGDGHTCALTSERAFCWGDDAARQLGHTAPLTPCSDAGADDCTTTPVLVDVIASAPQAIAAGRTHTCALLGDRSVVCWGSNVHGELGTGGASGAPRAVRDRTTGQVMRFTEIAAGGYTTCGRDVAGAVWCWGDGPLGSPVSADSYEWPSRVAF